MFNRAYDLAYFSFQEILLDAQIQISGANMSYFLEKYERKRKSMKTQILITKIIYAFIFGIMPLIPIITYFQTSQYFIEGIFPINVVIFIEGLLFSLYFLLQFVYFLSLRMLNFGIIMSGDAFRYFETLPLPKKKLYRIVFYTIFRSMDIPIVSMLIILPITIGIFTFVNYGLLLGIILAFACLISSAVNLLFSFSVLIIIGKKINFALNLNALNDKKSNLIRLFTMFSYIGLIFGTSFLIQWIFREIGTFLNFLTSFEYSYNVNLVLSLIAYPFSMSYIISFLLINREIPELLWLTSITGFIIMVVIIVGLVFFAIKSLKNVYSTPSIQISDILKIDSSEYKEKIKISSKTPLKAYIYKDLLSSTRDLESFMNMVMPFIITLVYTFSYFANASIEEAPIIFFYVIYLFVVLGFNPLISSILVVGLTNLEESGTTVLSSLPIKPRQQAKAKLIIMLTFNTLAVISPLLLYISTEDFCLILFLVILVLPVNGIMLISMFLLKIYYFGRRKYKYVVEEISPEKKILKWVLIFLLEYTFFFFFMISIGVLLFLTIIPGLIFAYITFVSIGFVLCYLAFNKMFPKKKMVKTASITLYISQSLENKPWFRILLITIFYFLASLLSFVPEILNYTNFWTSVSTSIIFDTLKFSCLSLLFFIVFPKLLGYSKSKKNLEKYFELVKMKWLKPLFKPTFIGILCGMAFSAISLIISFNFGYYSLFLTGITTFFLLTDSFWEEMLLRGIILSNLDNKSLKLKPIFINAMLSVLLYVILTINSYYSALQYGIRSEDITLQYNFILIVIFVSSLISSYIVLKTNNLLPAIMIKIFVYLPITYILILPPTII